MTETVKVVKFWCHFMPFEKAWMQAMSQYTRKNFVYQLVVHKIFSRSLERPKRIQELRYILYWHEEGVAQKGIAQSFHISIARVSKNSKGRRRHLLNS